MDDKYIFASVREFIRNYKEFAAKRKTIIITKNGKPQGIYMPYEKWKKLSTINQNESGNPAIKGRKTMG